MDDEIGTREAAKILGVGQRHVRWYWETGKLPGRIVIDRLVFRRADVEAFEKPKKTGRPRKVPAEPAADTKRQRGRTAAAEAGPAAAEPKKRSKTSGKEK
jgi:hypothetical protein